MALVTSVFQNARTPCPLHLVGQQDRKTLFRRAHRRLLSHRARCSPEDDRPPLEINLDLQPREFLTVSSVFYGAMTLASIGLGKLSGINVLDQITSSVNLNGAVLWLIPMLVFMFLSTLYADKFPSLRRIKEILQRTIVPSLKRLPAWGPAVLALGAGVGEEAFFRGWLQPFTINSLSAFPPDLALFFGIFFTSLFFGLCHYVTETYLIWATIFSVLFSLESIQFGLPAVMLTHGLYDWIAFISIQELWKMNSSD